MGKIEVINYKINWDTLENISNFQTEYDIQTDTLFIQSKEERPAVSVDCNGEFWVRVDPQTGEILGIEIEDFREGFLKHHRELLKTTYIRSITDFIRLEKCPV